MSAVQRIFLRPPDLLIGNLEAGGSVEPFSPFAVTDAIASAERALLFARLQGDSTLAGKLETEIDLYRTNVPKRDSALTNRSHETH